ncbi:ABC transporter permease [Mycoplasma crocodyli]|uniref:Putative membrane protein n=1 Tax=Mycoplasma crocodyli (strain ATCC 51981 / MP145) TaxID=512564 RepID=D5E5W3_MYCCM|nr:ABC transporter permease [Mycoplasma crocodyli]ADE19757.1 putative membrane protein [Mycoplasma crocodyli MP145]
MDKVHKYNFANYLWFYLMKKKTTFIIPLISFVSLFIIGISLIINRNYSDINFLIVIPIFVSLLMTVLFATIFSINIFKSMEREGLELIVCSRPVTRKNILATRIGFLFLFGFVYSLIIFVIFLIFLTVLKSRIGDSNYYRYLFSSFGVNLFAFYFFGLVTALLATKLNRRIAIAFSLTIFTPLFLVGNLSTYFSESRMNGYGVRLNNKYNDLDTYAFSLDNEKDKLYLVNRTEKNNYNEHKKLFNEVKGNANIAQVMGWLNIPYQMGIVSSNYGTDYFNNQRLSDSKYLSKVDFYSNNNDVRYKYLMSNDNIKMFVPTAPLINNDISDANLKWSTNNLIYAWENADSKNELVEDNFGFSSIDDFAGKLNWKVIQKFLHLDEFDEFFKENIKLDVNNKEATLQEFNSQIFDSFNEFGKNILFNEIFSRSGITESYQQQIYLYVITYYYMFYKHNQSSLFETILKNNKADVNQSQYKVQVKMKSGTLRAYIIGGFSSYLPIIETIKSGASTKQVSRMKLQKDENVSVFKEVSNIFTVQRSSTAFPDYGVALLWSFYILLLVGGVVYIYSRKDFK